MSKVMDRINATGLVPVVVIEDVATAVDTAKALAAGGVDVMEITMRTEAGLDSIKEVAAACPEMLVGAGTVLTMEQCKKAIENGAKFIVSPGYDPEIVQYCIDQNIDICPGCVTPTEITAGLKAGLRVLKFFPANIYGGLKAIKALRGPFPMIRFIPTGGVNLTNLADFMDPGIFAIGGGWLCEKSMITNREFSLITEISTKSIDILLGLQSEEGADITLAELMQKGGSVSTKNLIRAKSQLTRRGFELIAEGEKSAELVKDELVIQLSLS